MSPKSDSLRLFVAIYPPPQIVISLLECLRGLDAGARREVPPGQVHMTLQFIGERDIRELAEVQESVARSCAGVPAFRLAPKRLISLPDRGSPRLVAAETDAPAGVLEIHRRLALRLARPARREPADRFLPHLTLCRFRPGVKAARVDMPVACDAFEAPHVLLMRSVLKPSGAEHAEVARFPLES